MKPEIKERWIAALESGKYKKTDGVLKEETNKEVRHCCLGVLCELYLTDNKGSWNKDNFNRFSFVVGENSTRDVSVLPKDVQLWAGIESPEAEFMADSADKKLYGNTYLTIVNDSSRKSDFSEVIPIIRKYF